MRNVTIALFVALCIPAATAMAAIETWKNVSIVDTLCIDKVKDNPDAHTAKCALQCSKGGYGLITADGTYITFDADGNKKVVEALKNTKKADHLRATITGEITGAKSAQTIKLKSIAMNE